MKGLVSIHPDLELINKTIFKPCGLELCDLVPEMESQDYAAYRFKLNGQKVVFRRAKITALKTGQFVTTWKRNEKGVTAPFDIIDDIEFYVIAVRQEKQFGLFVFSKTVLHQNKILSDTSMDGKRGLRVYPNWDVAINKQAQKTQQWQTKCFLEMLHNQPVDLAKAKNLFKTSV